MLYILVNHYIQPVYKPKTENTPINKWTPKAQTHHADQTCK